MITPGTDTVRGTRGKSGGIPAEWGPVPPPRKGRRNGDVRRPFRHIMEGVDVEDHAPPGWARQAQDVDGLPLWRYEHDHVFIATNDMEYLRAAGMFLLRYRLSGTREVEPYLAAH